MKARIRYASNDVVEKKDFNTLKDLFDWIKKTDERIIIEDKMPLCDDENFDIYIQVYDDFIE